MFLIPSKAHSILQSVSCCKLNFAMCKYVVGAGGSSNVGWHWLQQTIYIVSSR